MAPDAGKVLPFTTEKELECRRKPDTICNHLIRAIQFMKTPLHGPSTLGLRDALSIGFNSAWRHVSKKVM